MQRIATTKSTNQGGNQMERQTTEFATLLKNGVIQKVGKSTVYQPKINFSDNRTKWYEDKLKKKADK